MTAHETGGSRPLRRLAGIVVGSLLVLLAVAGLKSYRDLAAAARRQGRLESEIATSRDRIEDLGRRISGLRDDPATLERLAREELGMVRPGDVVIVFPPGGRAAGEDGRDGAPASAPDTPPE